MLPGKSNTDAGEKTCAITLPRTSPVRQGGAYTTGITGGHLSSKVSYLPFQKQEVRSPGAQAI